MDFSLEWSWSQRNFFLLTSVLGLLIPLYLFITRKQKKTTTEQKRKANFAPRTSVLTVHKSVLPVGAQEDAMRRESVMDLDEVQKFALLATKGEDFLKFGRHGKPHKKHVVVSEGLIMWGKQKKRRISLTAVTKILETCETPVMKKNDGRVSDPTLCFSLVTDERTLDLQAVDVDQKAAWVEGLRGLISGKKLPPTSERISFDGNMMPLLPAQPIISSSLTVEEKEKVAHFRTAAAQHPVYSKYKGQSEYVEQIDKSERACARFLIARAFNVDDAVTMWANSVIWRFDNKMDQILDQPYSEVTAVEKLMNNNYMHKTDKFGRPLHIEHVGKLDVEATLKQYTVDQVVRVKCHLFEFKKKILMNFSETDLHLGKTGISDQTCAIIDLNGMSKSQFNTATLSFLKAVSKINQDYNPELMGKMFIINAPMMFSVIWRIVKVFLHERTRAKISIIRGPGIAEMLEVIDAESLPEFLGGKCECEGGCDSGGNNGKLYEQLCKNGLSKELAATKDDLNKYRDLYD